MLRPQLPPYSVEPATFRFPALAARAAKLPHGSGREATLATLLVVRLAADAAPGTELEPAVRAKRASAARDWIGALCPDARIRTACCAVADATAIPELQDDSLTKALTRLSEACNRYLDAGSRRELEVLSRATRAGR